MLQVSPPNASKEDVKRRVSPSKTLLKCNISQIKFQHCKAAVVIISHWIAYRKIFIYLWVVNGETRSLNFPHVDLLYVNGR